MADEETLYARYLSGELTPTEMEQLKQSGDLEKLDRIIATTDRFRLPSVNKKDGFDKLIQAKRKNSTGNIRSMPYTRWISGIAAAVLLGIGVFYFTKTNTVTLNAAYAQTMEHEFDDDSKVVLNAGSQIAYDTDNWDQHRVVRLEGEAYFDVRKGTPFVAVSYTHLTLPTTSRV